MLMLNLPATPAITKVLRAANLQRPQIYRQAKRVKLYACYAPHDARAALRKAFPNCKIVLENLPSYRSMHSEYVPVPPHRCPSCHQMVYGVSKLAKVDRAINPRIANVFIYLKGK